LYRSSNTLVPKFIVYLVFIGTLECRHPQSSSESGTLDKMPFAADDVEPKLGEGYDSLIQQLRNTPSCIKGTPVKLSSTGVNINFEQNVDSRDMMREFTGEVQGTPRIVFLPVGVGAGFYRSISNKAPQ